MPEQPVSRRTVLGVAGATVAAVAAEQALGAGPAAAAAPARRQWRHHPELAIRGADISFLLQEDEAGRRFTDRRGHRRPAERILAGAGANWARLRVWVDPPSGYSNLHTSLALARRCRAAGLKVLLDPHYSDFWADPGKQPIPAAWAGQDLAELSETVRRYTRHLVDAFARQGTPIDMIQIGNEVTNGMLWPVGQIYRNGEQHWDAFVRLLDAGLAGAREAAPRHRELTTMIHIDRGGDNAGARYFYDNVIQRNVRFDVIGLSYYPFWHGPLSALRANLDDLSGRYGKGLVVAETAYPWTLANGDSLANSLDSAAQLPDGNRFPPTPQGQLAYFDALREVIEQVPCGRGLGFFDWEPEWIPGVGWAPGQGNPNDNLTMFDFAGRALPSLAAFRRCD